MKATRFRWLIGRNLSDQVRVLLKIHDIFLNILASLEDYALFGLLFSIDK
jgi:hypothetical protein